MVSGMAAGIQTPVYFQSSYSLNFLPYYSKWADGWFGEVYGSMGIGVLYTERGYLTDIDQEHEEKDTDTGGGPSFRVEVRPGGVFYIAVDAIMGLGQNILIGGWMEGGTWSVGMVL